MQDWARELPAIAAERVLRQRRSSVSGSLLSAPAALALASAGLEPAGEAMGCAVMQLGGVGSYCGYSGMGPAPVVVSSGGSGRAWRGYGLYVKALYQGYDAALARLRAEATGLGADGVVGVDLQVVSLDTGTREFVALGTAVRWRTGSRPAAQPSTPGQVPVFLTELGGQDVAKAAAAGWAPLGVAIGLSLALRHRDGAVELASRMLAPNAEVAGLTHLVHDCRSDARDQFARRCATFPGAAQAVVSSMRLRTFEAGCSMGSDAGAEAMMVGTVLGRSGPGRTEPPPVLQIMSLRGTGSRPVRRTTSATADPWRTEG